jgi:hypothetical protein
VLISLFGPPVAARPARRPHSFLAPRHKMDKEPTKIKPNSSFKINKLLTVRVNAGKIGRV